MMRTWPRDIFPEPEATGHKRPDRDRSSGTIPFILTLLSLLLTCSACEEVIDLDLEDMNQQLVIEGIVSDKPSASKVVLSYSQNIFARLPSKSISDATVTLRDDNGYNESLREGQPGVFTTTSTGVIGRTYHLQVQLGGVTYTASSRMPEPMRLDSARWKGGAYIPFFTTRGSFIYYLSNKPSVEEYCLVKTYNLYDAKPSWFVTSDKYTDGKQIAVEGPSFSPTSSSVRIEVIAIDRPTYEYLRRLKDVIGDEGIDIPDIFRMNDYNPPSNISPDALGYFSAQSQRDYTVSVR